MSSYYRTYLAPFLRGICKDHLDRCGKSAPSIDDLDEDVLNKYLFMISHLHDEGFLDIETGHIYENFHIWLRSGAKEDAQIIVDSMRDAFLDKFKPDMNKFLGEEWDCEMEEVESERLYGLGYTTTVDKETGERIWQKPKNVQLPD